jgi:hypothetical protein
LAFLSVLVPTEPQNVNAKALSSTSIGVTWSEPENTYGEIDRYVVYYQETVKENGYNEMTFENGNRARVLTSLQVKTEYSISVQAFTSAGGGKWSETIKKMTKSDSKNLELIILRIERDSTT